MWILIVFILFKQLQFTIHHAPRYQRVVIAMTSDVPPDDECHILQDAESYATNNDLSVTASEGMVENVSHTIWCT